MTYPYETATPKQGAVGSWWWCIHHETHLERLTEPPENRTAFITANKPAKEVDHRLREFAPVLHPERLPEKHNKACAEYDKAWAEYDKARAEGGKAWAEYDKARAEYGKACAEYDKALAEVGKARAEVGKALAEVEPELMALHREEYPSTTWDGNSIFGGGK